MSAGQAAVISKDSPVEPHDNWLYFTAASLKERSHLENRKTDTVLLVGSKSCLRVYWSKVRGGAKSSVYSSFQ